MSINSAYPVCVRWRTPLRRCVCRYIEQGQELLVTSSEEMDYPKSIYTKYISAVNIAQGTVEPIELQDKDEKIVSAYVDRANPHDLEAGFTTTNYEKIIAELTMMD